MLSNSRFVRDDYESAVRRECIVNHFGSVARPVANP